MATRTTDNGKVAVENVNVPGHSVQLDSAKYHAMRKAIVAALPGKPPGLTQSEIRHAVVAHLSDELFPGGGKVAWWAKMVQLDLEAKGIVDREATKPLRWHLHKARRRK